MTKKTPAYPLMAILAFALIASLTSPVQASEGLDRFPPRETVLLQTDHMTITEDGDWIYYRRAAELPGAEERTEHGKKGGDERTAEIGTSGEALPAPLCSFSSEIELAEDAVPKGSVFISRQIALNLTDCIAIYEEAVVRESDLVQLGLGTEEEDRTGYLEASESAVPSSDGALGTSASTKSGTYETRYEDPPNLDVNRLRTQLTWTYTGSCVTNSWNHNTKYKWAGWTGWNKLSSWTSASRTCSEAKTWSYAKFKNSAFCEAIAAFLPFPLNLAWALLQPPTYAKYNTTKIRGKSNGAVVLSTNQSKWGGCDSWLSKETRYYSYIKN